MTYAGSLNQPSVVELAREGNLRAIAAWLNSFLVLQGLAARVGVAAPGCLQILVEFPPTADPVLSHQVREPLVRFICHRIWSLDSDVIEGVRIVARFLGESDLLWKQSVRIVTPANQKVAKPRSVAAKAAKSSQVAAHAAQRFAGFKMARSFLLSGSAVAAFIVGCWLGYSDAPAEFTNAAASTQAESSRTEINRPNIVQAALETVPVSTPSQIAEPNDPQVNLMFAGDVTLANSFAEVMGQDYDRAFAKMDEFRQADVAMVNLENPVTKAKTPLPNKKFNFKSDPDSVQVLTSGGVDIVTLANNHAMDYKTEGLVDTLETLDQAGIRRVGAGRDLKEARRPEIIEVKGQRIAYLGYYGGDFSAAGESSAGVNAARNERIAEDIKAIRQQVDWIVVNYHWGKELARYPTAGQIELAHFTIDQGADLVVGHHPHVLQGAEIYKGRAIAYSLGNFIFGGNSRSNYDTAVLKVALKDKQMKVEFLPVQVRKYQPKVVAGERGDRILNQIQKVSNIFEQPMQSPVVLDAQSNQTVEAPAANPSPSSIAPTPSPSTPNLEVPSATPDTTTPDSTVKKKRAKPANSFIDSPNSTPFNSADPQNLGIDQLSPHLAPPLMVPEPPPPSDPVSPTSAVDSGIENGLSTGESGSPTLLPDSPLQGGSETLPPSTLPELDPLSPTHPLSPDPLTVPTHPNLPDTSGSTDQPTLSPQGQPANSLEPLTRRYASQPAGESSRAIASVKSPVLASSAQPMR